MAKSLTLLTLGRSALLFLALLIFPVLLSSPAQAETPTKLYGVITSSEDEPLSDIGISILGPDGFSSQAATNEQGDWEVPILSKGSYSITINVDDLPEGQALTNPDKGTVKANVFMLGVDLRILFPIGPGIVQSSLLERSAQLTLDGILLGLVIALAALGLSLIFGTTGLTNFAHGEILTLAGLLTYYLSAIVGLPVLAAAPLAVLLGALISGFLQDKYLWKPLRRRGTGLIAMLVISIGLAIFLRYFFLFIFGGDTRQLPQYAGQAGIELGLLSFTPKSILTTVIGILLILGATLWLLRTRMGKASRAVADNPALASASGIDVQKVIRAVWILGAALASYAGVIVTINQGVSFLMGQDMLLLIFAAVTLGGLGTANGALVGSLIIGLFVQLSTLFIPTELKYVGALIVLILILIIRPQGILGKKERIG
jgi:neutral amino acid transport system permease protein|uniref:branched-chain amino acid ABC transporter permease n=1 Tax=Candidatus Planktophila sp. TaxID=2175601 RepID=UPI00404BA215